MVFHQAVKGFNREFDIFPNYRLFKGVKFTRLASQCTDTVTKAIIFCECSPAAGAYPDAEAKT